MSTTHLHGVGPATITENAAVHRGVTLDRLESTGPRGGKIVLWRAAAKRQYQVASWSATKGDAAK